MTVLIHEELISLLTTYQLPAVFLGAFVGGEGIIITTSFLASRLNWNMASVFTDALLGTVLSDVTWYYGGRYILTRMKRWEDYRTRHQATLTQIEKKAGQRPWLLLLYIKFLYGTRILTVLYLSLRRVSIASFVLFDTLGTMVWLVVVMTIGWLAERGAINLIPFLDTLEHALIILIIAIITVKLMSLWIAKQLTNK